MDDGGCPDRLHQAKKAWNFRCCRLLRAGLWNYLCITICLAHLVPQCALRQPWLKSRTKDWCCQSRVTALWHGSRTLSSDSSAGNRADCTWRKLCGSRSAIFRRPCLHGDVHNTNYPPKPCWNGRSRIWTARPPPPCESGLPGSRNYYKPDLPATTGPGSLQWGTNTAPTSSYFKDNFGHMWWPGCDNASRTRCCKRSRTRSSIWLPASGTRTTSLLYARGSCRRHNWSSNNGFRTTSGISTGLCHLQKLRRQTLTETPSRGAQQIHHRRHRDQLWVLHLADRPGPKSRGARTIPPGTPTSSRVLHECVSRNTNHSPCADARVGGSVGRSPPEAVSCSTLKLPYVAKLIDPFWLLSSCQALDPPEPQLPTVSSASFSAPHAPTLHDSPLLYRRLALGQQTCRHFLESARPAPTGRQPTTLLSAGVCSVFLGLALLLVHRLRKRTPVKLYCTFRVFRGTYRRRKTTAAKVRRQPCKALLPAANPGSKRPKVESCPTPPARASACIRSKPALAALAFLLSCRPGTAHNPTGRQPVRDLTPPTGTLRAYGRMAQQLSATRKRSFRRAQQRALRDGSVLYKGRVHTTKSLQLEVLGNAPSRSPQSVIPTQCLRIVTWNAGGLHAGRYTELLAWLEAERQAGQPVHIACIQETHWPQDSEFVSGHWQCLHSGSGKSQGGILFLIGREVAPASALRFASLEVGRLFHVRIMREQVVDLLGVYQYAWSTSASPTDFASSHTSKLLALRSSIWQKLQGWVRSVPARNTMLAMGDVNCTLQPSPPHVGQGVALHRTSPHADQPIFQSVVQNLGLVALNTWGRRGKEAGTFLQFDQHSVQLDFLLTRLPGKPPERRATVQPEASIVHPTGLRHAPVTGFLSTHPTTTRQCPNPQPKPHQIQSTFQAHPHLEHSFQTQVEKLLPTHSIEDALQRAWLECTADTPQLPLQSPPTRARPCLKSFWESKRRLRELSGQIDLYFGPTLWYVADSGWRALSRHLPGCLNRLRPFLQTWRAHVLFRQEDKLLRQRAKASKVQQVSEIIRLAELHQPQGLQTLYRLSKRLAPKSAKKSIHFRHHDGSLMSDQEELQSLTDYFRKLYRADLRLPTAWSLGQPLHRTGRGSISFKPAVGHQSAPSWSRPCRTVEGGAIRVGASSVSGVKPSPRHRPPGLSGVMALFLLDAYPETQQTPYSTSQPPPN